jgi:Fucose permease
MAFISLGLPDSLIGSAWPVMQSELAVPVSFAGIITMIIAFGTIISSLLSDKLTRKLGAGLVTAISVLLTAIALFGFSVSHSFILLCLCAIPYGLGAGAVDAALNNYVALHYTSRHMSWLHCSWGVGAAISPYIMGHCLTGGYGWNTGYRIVGVLQIILTIILFVSLPLWKKRNTINTQQNEISYRSLSLLQALQIKGVPLMLITFFSYCALEQTTMLWASSYLVQYREVNVNVAARFASLFFLGITFGRFLCGFVADKFGDKLLIRIGIFTSMAGMILVALPLKTDILALAGLIIIGFGCAPTYPAIIHSTPFNFGKENSQAIIGIQMASAYVGTTFMPPLFGLIASNISIGLYPLYLITFAVLMLFMSELLNKFVAKREAEKLQLE